MIIIEKPENPKTLYPKTLLFFYIRGVDEYALEWVFWSGVMCTGLAPAQATVAMVVEMRTLSVGDAMWVARSKRG